MIHRLPILGGLAALTVALSACGGGGSSAQVASTSTTDHAVIVVRGDPDASVWIDGRHVGSIGAAKGGFALSPGSYRVEVRLDGFHTYYGIVELEASSKVVVDPELAPALP